MKEIVVWRGQKYALKWIDKVIPEYLKKLQQVYGFLFTEEGKICVNRPNEEAGWRLCGGSPESEDKSWEDTIIREAMEEADIVLRKDSLKILGIIEITPLSQNCERGFGYALRVFGRIKSVEEQTEDVAAGVINERAFIDHQEFLNYCPWGKIGKLSRDKAVGVFNET